MAPAGRSESLLKSALNLKCGMLVFLLVAVAPVSNATAASQPLAPAFFVFGDSTVDTGNQNFITSAIKSNFPPYGRDLVPPRPTGRFSNGKLANDYIAEFLGLPSPPNALSPQTKGTSLLKGVNFASSGSGYLNITGIVYGVISLQEQMKRFVRVKSEISRIIGPAKTKELISKSLYLISTGSNDFINSYNINPALQRRFSIQQYQKLILASISAFITELYQRGGRYVIINSLGPLGCAPEQVFYVGSGKCAESVNAAVIAFNYGLQQLLAQFRSLPGVQLLYSNVYDVLDEAIKDPAAFGFKKGAEACCGLGNNGGAGPCSPLSNVCPNADDYIFWDLFHPSQAMYKNIADGAVSGSRGVIFPMNLNQLLKGT